VQTKGETVTIPVSVMNDLPAPWTGEVTLKLMQGPKVVHRETGRLAEVATGYRASQDYAVTFPDSKGVDYTLIAEHTHGGTTLQSVRNLKTNKTRSCDRQDGYRKFGRGAVTLNRREFIKTRHS
jgi:hypothetical protein